MHVNVGPMNVRLNDEPYEEVECFKYSRLQVTADGGCEREEMWCTE